MSIVPIDARGDRLARSARRRSSARSARRVCRPRRAARPPASPPASRRSPNRVSDMLSHRQPVAAARHQHRDDDADVVLPEIEVVALDVHEAELLLAEAVERLVGARAATAGARGTCARPAPPRGRGCVLASVRIGRPAESRNRTAPVGARDAHPQRGRSHRHRLRRRGNRPRGAAAALRRGDQRRAVEERAVRCIRDPDDVVGADLDLQRRAW